MYKQLGFRYDDLPTDKFCRILDRVHQVINFYHDNNLMENVSPPTNKRASSRVKILATLPPELHMNIWFLYRNRFRKCLIKDVSESGAGVILPFDDLANVFNQDRPFTALIDLSPTASDTTLAPYHQPMIIRSVIRYEKSFAPPENLKAVLDALNQEYHSMDSAFGDTSKKKSSTMDYSGITYSKIS